jgi:SpoVK/Ycf46/Vps4 family AAA+-type ATPase
VVSIVARRRLGAVSSTLMTPLVRPYEWDDLVVAADVLAQLRELEAQVRLSGEVLDGWGFRRLTPGSRGTTALFAGPSGTGKTMAAQVLAHSLDLDLYRVDLAEVVNKYIGETEKRLAQVFDECERCNVMVLFDEADALFGRRTRVHDAHDRFANIEIDYLLQRMESFDGVAILATNRKGDLDPAFTRRIRVVVDFLPPSPVERLRLWELALPECSAVAQELDRNWLADSLTLTGAEIKSIALAAAFLARSTDETIAMEHVLAAVRRELAKRGTVLRAETNGHANRAVVVGG